MKDNNFEYTSENISKYWKILNNSRNQDETKLANSYFTSLKNKCQNCIEICVELFSSSDMQDKFISSLLIYQYLKENPMKYIDNEELFNKIKNDILNKILQLFANESEENIFKSENTLIIERIRYITS